MPQIIGVKQLYKNLKDISKTVSKGKTFIVVKRSKPIFKIVPYKERENKYCLKDFEDIQFEGKDEKLSQKIDKIVYSVK